MRPINILRVITWLPVGGIERRLVALLPRLDRERFNVSVVCIRERGPLADALEAAGVPVACIPFRRRWDLAALRRLAGLMREQRTDIVHSHMYRSNVPATVAGRMARVPHVWAQVHNVDTWETRRQLWMDRQLCRWRDGAIAVSECVRRDVMASMQLPAERVRVIYNGIDVERFARARSRRGEIRRREGVGDVDTVFLFMARLVEQKRPGDFLEAIGRLQMRQDGERVCAWVLGDGPMSKELKRHAETLPHPDRIRFFGRRDDIENYLPGADAFVLPSIKEGFSNALLEAMASGLAIVATDVGGNAEAIRDGRDGLIVEPNDPDALEEVMLKLWTKRDLRASLAVSAAERAQTFSLDQMQRNVEALYLETMTLNTTRE